MSDTYRSPVTVRELIGESLIRTEDGEIDEGVRMAALLDGLRKLAVEESSPTDPEKLKNTLECKVDWDGLKVSTSTVRRNGIVVRDVVRVSLSVDNLLGSEMKWRVRNMKLVEPAKPEDIKLSVLQDALLVRGITLSGSHRLGQDIWCEVLSIKRWVRE